MDYFSTCILVIMNYKRPNQVGPRRGKSKSLGFSKIRTQTHPSDVAPTQVFELIVSHFQHYIFLKKNGVA